MKKSQLSGLKQKEQQDAYKERKKKQKGEKIKRQQPKHTNAKIPTTSTTLMTIQRRSVGNCI